MQRSLIPQGHTAAHSCRVSLYRCTSIFSLFYLYLNKGCFLCDVRHYGAIDMYVALE